MKHRKQHARLPRCRFPTEVTLRLDEKRSWKPVRPRETPRFPPPGEFVSKPASECPVRILFWPLLTFHLKSHYVEIIPVPRKTFFFFEPVARVALQSSGHCHFRARGRTLQTASCGRRVSDPAPEARKPSGQAAVCRAHGRRARGPAPRGAGVAYLPQDARTCSCRCRVALSARGLRPPSELRPTYFFRGFR